MFQQPNRPRRLDTHSIAQMFAQQTEHTVTHTDDTTAHFSRARRDATEAWHLPALDEQTEAWETDAMVPPLPNRVHTPISRVTSPGSASTHGKTATSSEHNTNTASGSVPPTPANIQEIPRVWSPVRANTSASSGRASDVVAEAQPTLPEQDPTPAPAQVSPTALPPRAMEPLDVVAAARAPQRAFTTRTGVSMAGGALAGALVPVITAAANHARDNYLSVADSLSTPFAACAVVTGILAGGTLGAMEASQRVSRKYKIGLGVGTATGFLAGLIPVALTANSQVYVPVSDFVLSYTAAAGELLGAGAIALANAMCPA